MTSVFLPGEVHGQKSLEGHSPWEVTGLGVWLDSSELKEQEESQRKPNLWLRELGGWRCSSWGGEAGGGATRSWGRAGV